MEQRRVLQKPQEQMVYKLAILRKDFQHILVMESEDFEEAKKAWRDVTDKWRKAVEDKMPMEIESPIISSFDPGLVNEITISAEPKGVQQTLGKENPYVQQMKKDGIGGTMRNAQVPGSDILDGGFK